MLQILQNLTSRGRPYKTSNSCTGLENRDKSVDGLGEIFKSFSNYKNVFKLDIGFGLSEDRQVYLRLARARASDKRWCSALSVECARTA